MLTRRMRKRKLSSLIGANTQSSSPPRKRQRRSTKSSTSKNSSKKQSPSQPVHPQPEHESKSIVEHRGNGKSRKYLVKHTMYYWETSKSLPMGLIYEYNESMDAKRNSKTRSIEPVDTDSTCDQNDENTNPNIVFEREVESDEATDTDLPDDEKEKEGEENDNADSADPVEEQIPQTSLLTYLTQLHQDGVRPRGQSSPDSFNNLCNLDRAITAIDVQFTDMDDQRFLNDDDEEKQTANVQPYIVLDATGQVDENNKPIWKLRGLTQDERRSDFLKQMKLQIWMSGFCYGKENANRLHDFDSKRCDYKIPSVLSRAMFRYGYRLDVKGVANSFVRWGCDGNPYTYVETDFKWTDTLHDEMLALCDRIERRRQDIAHKRAHYPHEQWRSRQAAIAQGFPWMAHPFEATYANEIQALQSDERRFAECEEFLQAAWGDSSEAMNHWMKLRRFRSHTNNYVWRDLPRLFQQQGAVTQLSNYCTRVSLDDMPFFIRETFQFGACVRQVLSDVLKSVPREISKLIGDFTLGSVGKGDCQYHRVAIALVPFGVDTCASQGFDFSKEWYSTYILQANCSDDNAAARCEVVFGNVAKVSDRAHDLMIGVKKEDVQQTVLTNLKTSLHLYQVRNCLWACDLERMILSKCQFVFGPNDMYSDCASPHFNGDASFFRLALDHVEQKIYTYDERDDDRPCRYITTRGGILADEVGLGKTLSMISVVVAHPATQLVLDQLKCVKTTVVVCPNHLVHQWKEQIETHTTSGSLNVYEISTKRTFEAITPGRLVEADVIIISIQFLSGVFYKKYRWTNKSWLERTKFYRLIVDEGHEYDKPKEIELVLSLNSVLHWYLSATPFPKPERLGFCCELIRLQVCDKSPRETDFLLTTPVGDVIEQVISRYCFMRNTKSSIDESSIPQRVEVAAFVNLHPIERVVYEIQRRKAPSTIKAVCNDIFSLWPYTSFQNPPPNRLGMVPQYMVRQSKEKLIQLHRDKKYHQLEVRRARMDRMGPKAIQDKQSRVARVDCEIDNVQCDIQKLSSRDLYHRADKWAFDNRNEPRFKEMTMTRGSKFAQALRYIQNVVTTNPSARVICFSNFDRVLEKYHEQLTEMGVACGYCSGNVFVRRKAMRGFQSDGGSSVRVIFLSIKKAASGADLKNATHVCLLDPVGDSLSKSLADEEQAVGRALRQGMGKDKKCNVIRFVARDTVEQEVFERNKSERNRRKEEQKKRANERRAT